MSNTKQDRLYWACRRGALELDIVLQNFLAQVYPGLSAPLQEDFDRLLDCDDQVLLTALRTGQIEETDLKPIVELLVQHAQSAPVSKH